MVQLMLELDFSNIKSQITKIRWDTTLKSTIIEKTKFLPVNASISERLYCIHNNLFNRPLCEVCKNEVVFKKFNQGYNRFCSPKCKNSSALVKNKRKLTNINKYGGNTPLSSKRIRQKVKSTMMKRYGVDNPSKSDSIKEKKKNTLLKNYEVENPSQSIEIQDKKRKTSLKKYGHTHWLKSKKKQTQFSKILLTNHSIRKIEKLKHIVTPMFDLNEYTGVNHQNKYNWQCVICEYPFTDHLDDGRIPECPICLAKFKSRGEKEIYNYINQFLKFQPILRNTKQLTSPKELDIVIPNLKIAIEFNGVYWHSERKLENKNYHLHKTELCENQGYQLLHIFDTEWNFSQAIVKSRLKAILNVEQNKIYARHCKIKPIDTYTKNEFLDTNHIQRSCPSSINYGLFYNNALVAVMTFGKPRFTKKYQWELIRYCSKINCIVIGGASKLLKTFEREYLPQSIISYADRRWSIGKLYRSLNFTLEKITSPNYFYFNANQPAICFLESRNAYQKHKLSKILKTFNPSLTEWENMKANNYDRIWDCGNLVFIKEY